MVWNGMYNEPTEPMRDCTPIEYSRSIPTYFPAKRFIRNSLRAIRFSSSPHNSSNAWTIHRDVIFSENENYTPDSCVCWEIGTL